MSGNIFINYRHGDQAAFAGRLCDWLGQAFPRNQLFMDVDNIPLGADYVEYLDEQVSKCDAMLVVIGESWLEAKDTDGRRRIDQPDDPVAIEIVAALKSRKWVIPVLVGNTHMVREADLPPSLHPLARRHAVRITHERFRSDVERDLVPALRSALESLKPLPVSPAAPISAPLAASVVAQEPPAPVVAAAAIPAPPEGPSVARNVTEVPPAEPSDAPVIPAEPTIRDAPAIPQSTAAPISAPAAAPVVAQEPPAPMVAAAEIPARFKGPTVARNVAESLALLSDSPVIPAKPAVLDAPAIPQSTAAAIPQSTAAPPDSVSVALSVLWFGLLPWVIYTERTFWIPRDALSASVPAATLNILYLLSVVLYWRHRGWSLPMAAVAIPIIGVLGALFFMLGLIADRSTVLGVNVVEYVAIGGILSWWAFKKATNPRPLHRAIALSALWLTLILRILAFFLNSGLGLVLVVLYALLGGVAFFSMRRFER